MGTVPSAKDVLSPRGTSLPSGSSMSHSTLSPGYVHTDGASWPCPHGAAPHPCLSAAFASLGSKKGEKAAAPPPQPIPTRPHSIGTATWGSQRDPEGVGSSQKCWEAVSSMGGTRAAWGSIGLGAGWDRVGHGEVPTAAAPTALAGSRRMPGAGGAFCPWGGSLGPPAPCPLPGQEVRSAQRRCGQEGSHHGDFLTLAATYAAQKVQQPHPGQNAQHQQGHQDSTGTVGHGGGLWAPADPPAQGWSRVLSRPGVMQGTSVSPSWLLQSTYKTAACLSFPICKTNTGQWVRAPETAWGFTPRQGRSHFLWVSEHGAPRLGTHQGGTQGAH